MVDVAHEQAGSRGRYVLRRDGAEAELTYTIHSDSLRSADHAGAPLSMRGQGIGVQLIEQMVADARQEGWKIRPDCPFVAHEGARHPEWADAFVA